MRNDTVDVGVLSAHETVLVISINGSVQVNVTVRQNGLPFAMGHPVPSLSVHTPDSERHQSFVPDLL